MRRVRSFEIDFFPTLVTLPPRNVEITSLHSLQLKVISFTSHTFLLSSLSSRAVIDR